MKPLILNIAEQKTSNHVQRLDELLTYLCTEIPTGMEIQIFANKDGFNCELLDDELGKSDHRNLKEVWSVVEIRNYEMHPKMSEKIRAYAKRIMKTKNGPKRKSGAVVRSNRIVLRRVYRGWINPNMPDELPKKVDDRTDIVFGSYAWADDDRRCRITVEIYGKPQNVQAHL